MAGSIKLEVVTPQLSVTSEDAQIVMAPGTLGEFGALVGHTPFLTTLNVGAIKYKDEQGQEHFIFVSGGFAEVLPDKVTILAESAERRKDIDIDRAKEALQRAQKRLDADGKAADEIDFTRARAALQRAIQRISLVETRH